MGDGGWVGNTVDGLPRFCKSVFDRCVIYRGCRNLLCVSEIIMHSGSGIAAKCV